MREGGFNGLEFIPIKLQMPTEHNESGIPLEVS
jgi:hypothetical protein